MDSKQQVLNLIGLATKAGKVKSGEFSTEQSIKKGRAEEASENTKKRFQDMCGNYHVNICFLGSRAELGRFTGKELRASLAVEDRGFAEAIGKRMTMNGGSKV